jgi:hypothetical protein
MATFDFSVLQGIPEQVANLLFELSQKIVGVESDGSLSLAGKNAKIDQLVGAALAELDRLEQTAQSEGERIETRAKILLDGKPEPESVQEKILSELRAQRLWSRMRRKLDAHQDNAALLRAVEDIIDRAGREADRLTIQVLREELPDYLAARRLTAPQIFDWLNQAELPLMTPEQRQARQALMTLEANLPRVLAAIDTARQAIAKKAFKVPSLPGWNGQILHLNW